MSKHRSIAQGMAFAVVLAGLLVIVAMAQAQGGMIIGQVTSPGGYPLPDAAVVKLFEPGEWDTFGQAAAAWSSTFSSRLTFRPPPTNGPSPKATRWTPKKNNVVMQIDHFTDFALTGTPGREVFLPLTATGK